MKKDWVCQSSLGVLLVVVPSASWGMEWSELQALINAASPGRGLELSEMVINGDQHINVQENVIIDGGGNTLAWNDSNVSDPVFEFKSGSGLKNLTLKFNTGAQNLSSSHMNNIFIVRESRADVVLDNVHVQDFVATSSNTHSPAGFHIQSANSVRIVDSSFKGNLSQAWYYGGAIYVGSANELVVEGTKFLNNRAGQKGGAVYFGEGLAIAGNPASPVSGHYVFGNCVFEGNVSRYTNGSYGGAVAFVNTKAPVFLIDTSFVGNKAEGTRSYGGAIYAQKTSWNGLYGDTLHITDPSKNWVIAAVEKDIVFSDNSMQYDGLEMPNDILLNQSGVRLQASPDKTIAFKGGIIGFGPSSSVVHINFPNQIFTDVDGNANELPHGGTVLLQAPIKDVAVKVYDGTICLDDNGAERGNELAYASLEVVGSVTSAPEKENLFTLSTVHPKQAASDNVRLRTTDASFLQDVYIGTLTMHRDARLVVDVDLLQAKGDTFEAGSNSQSNGYHLLVSEFNILQDADPNTKKVDVALVPNPKDSSNPMLDVLGLAPEAEKAVYDNGVFRSTWKVTYAEEGKKGIYTFKREGPRQMYGQTDEEDKIPMESFSPGVFVPAAAYEGVSLVQHGVTSGAFSPKLMAAPEDEAGHQYLWAYAKGSDLNLSPENYGGIESRYAMAMAGAQVQPWGRGDTRFGVYLGAVRGQLEKDSDWKLTQNGGFVGLTAEKQGEHLFARVNADLGVMDSKSSSTVDHGKFTTYWFGAALEAGAVQRWSQDLRFEGTLGLSYLHQFGNRYTSGKDVHFEVGSFKSVEIYPQLNVVWNSDEHWQGLAHARYAFTHQKDASVRAQSVAVPNIEFGDYAEFGLGLLYQNGNFSADLRVNRIEVNRQGWNGSLLLTQRF